MNNKLSMDATRLDGETTVFFQHQLELVKAQTYDQKLGDLKALTGLFTISSQLPPGATELTWRSWQNYGLAKFVTDYAKDFPRCDIGGTEQSRRVHDIGSSYGYSLKEIQRAAYAGVPLESKRAAACRRAIEEKLSDIALNGDLEHNIPGFINYPGMSAYVVPATGTGVTKTWSTKSADQILTDLWGILNVISNATLGKEAGNTILLPKANYDLIRQKRLDTTMEKSVYQYFVENNPGVRIDWLTDLTDAGDSSTTRMMAYVNDSMHIELEIPMMFEQQEEYKDGPMSYMIPALASTVGVICYYPVTIVYADGI